MSLTVVTVLFVNPNNVLAQPYPTLTIQEAPESVATNISHHLDLKSKSCVSNKQHNEQQKQILLDAIDQKIMQALQALGYYHATWQKQLTFTDQCWNINLTLDVGIPVTLVDVQIIIEGEAQQDLSFTRLVTNAPLRVGDQLHHGQYDAFKKTLHNTALQRGYREGRYTEQTLLVNVESNTAQIKLTFHSGPRYSFGPVLFEQDFLDESFLIRYLPFSPRAPFDAGQLGKFQRSLINSRYFKEVSVRQLPADPVSHEIPVRVILTPAAHYSTAFGIGIATDTGPRGSLSFKNNRANRTGHHYGAQVELSAIKSSLNFDYQIPLSQPDREKTKLTTGWENEETDTSENRTWSVRASRTTTTNYDWLKTIDLAYQVETFSVADASETTQLVIPGVSFHRSYADNLIFPTTGWRLQGGLRLASEKVGSDMSFVQFRGSAKTIFSIGKGRLLSRVDAGTSAVSQFDELPASLRFFAGGDNSVRGFGYEKLGPINDDNEVIGGKHLLTASLEYDYPVYKQYGLAVFVDAGNAFDNSQFTFKRSVGIGGRWRSPLGPIRVDFAFPLGDENSFRLHLSMGPDL